MAQVLLAMVLLANRHLLFDVGQNFNIDPDSSKNKGLALDEKIFPHAALGVRATQMEVSR